MAELDDLIRWAKEEIEKITDTTNIQTIHSSYFKGYTDGLQSVIDKIIELRVKQIKL